MKSLLIVSAAFAAAIHMTAPPEIVAGRATVVDGDTIEIKGQRIRLWGIDAPEARQPGGKAAAQELDAFLAAARPAICYERDTDRYGRMVGTCYRADGKDAAQHMVATGNALDWPKFSGGYYAEWQVPVTFGKPWEWRAGK